MSQNTVSIENNNDNVRHEQDLRKNLDLSVLMSGINGHNEYNSLSPNLFNDSGDIIFALSKSLEITSLNPEFEKKTGWFPEAWIGKSFLSLISEEDRNKTKKKFETLKKDTDSTIFELNIISNYGNNIPMEIVVTNDTSYGITYGYFGIARDLSDRKNTEKTKNKFENRLSTIIDTIPDIIFQLDTKGNFSFINKSVNNYGYSHDDLIGKSIFSIIHPRDRKKAKYHINERRTGKRATKSVEIRLLDKNKNIFECSLSAQKLYKDPVISFDTECLNNVESPNENVFIGIQGIARDISDCRQAQKELRKKENNLRFLIENQTDMVIKMDISGKILFVSPSYCEMFGKTSDEIINESFMPLVFEDDSEATINAMANLLKPPYACYIEHRIMTVKGWKWVAWNDKAIVDKNNEIIAIVGIGRDITERKNLEAQFLQSQKMETVAQLAGGIAHDFNNMLTVIMGYSEMSLMNLSSEDSIYGNINEISKTANRAANLTRQLLAFSRHQIIEPKDINLNKVLSGIDKMLRRLIDDNIEYITIPSEDLWTVRIDPGQIEQVLSNLVINARDSMPDGGKIIVETANITLDEEYTIEHIAVKAGDYVMISVSDTGHGMDEKTRLRIFEPFFTTKEKDKGTGLGLSTCYGIVKQNNGNIWIYSEPGLGSTFKIYLPRVKDNPYEELFEESIETVEDGFETILIVEDEPSLRGIAANVLKEKGYTVLEASNGEEALKIARDYLPDKIHLVVSDVVMPHMGGIELSERLIEYYPEVKVLFMSGYTDNSIVHHGILKPGIKFLQKPFSPRKFLEKVRQILERNKYTLSLEENRK